ncbi:hypothetical protein TanjilG_16457 [Lupinus angustifolius]|uniref:Uncharacterized protein n=1 Tax=Lupinus angustifolius TaxID=3871 RepID=A0A1J7GSB9_LUPAN|nr:hypothetical protein TanjilG_16457 [Lupinus angustifolius]
MIDLGMLTYPYVSPACEISGRGCGAQGIPNIPKCENHSMGEEGDHWNRRSCG